MIIQSTQAVEPCYGDLVSYVLDHTSYDPNQPVLIDAANESHSISLKEARHYVRSIVRGLEVQGLKPGDTVCLHMFNHIMFPVLFLGIVGAGARFTASNPAYTASELGHHLKTSEAKFVITEKAHLGVVQEATNKNNISCNHIFLHREDFEKDDGYHLSIQLLMSSGQKDWIRFDDEKMSKHSIIALNSTSGTTGLPKMAARSHHSLVMEGEVTNDFVDKAYDVRRLLCAPFFHGFAAPLAVISPLRFGNVTYVMRKFDCGLYLDSIERYRITETAMPPPLIIRFLSMAKSERSMLKSLYLVWSGGAPLAADTQNSALQMFAQHARICQVWGMTEGGWFTTLHYPESDYTGAVGRLLPTYEAKLIHDDGSEIEKVGEAGEILVRGPINMLRYHNNPQATNAIIDKDGWLKTGDVATLSEDGKIYVVDRKKELIKVRGWQVAPSEIESRLIAHEDIVDAAVIGISHPELASEIPRAYVVCRPGSSVTAEKIKSYLLQSLAKYKVMDCEFAFRTSIPKSASGKILKRCLREEAAAETK